MAFLKHWVLLLAAIYTVIVATKSSPAGGNRKGAEDQEPLLTRIVRQVAFRGQSQGPRFPGTNNGQCDCQFHVVCASQLDKIQQNCQLPNGGTGVCCPPVGGVGFRNQNTNMINSDSHEVDKFSEIEKIILRRPSLILKRWSDNRDT